MDQQIYNFDVRFSNFTKLSPQVAKVKIYIAYSGKNRNKTSFSKEVLQNMADTSLRGVPVVGEWIEKNNNFGGHGGKLEITDTSIEWITTTIPYGYIDTDTEISWETVREKDGITEHEYLTCTAYLWYGRYPELEKVLDDGSWQSMEVSVVDGYLDEDGYYVAKDAYFNALCILGKDSDKSKNVEPCFESSQITRYTLDKEDFKVKMQEMINELKFSLQQSFSEEVKLVDEVKDTVVEEAVVEAEMESTQTDEVVEDKAQDVVDEIVEETLDEVNISEEVADEIIKEQISEEAQAGTEEFSNDETTDNGSEELVELQSKYSQLENENIELKSKLQTLESYKYAREKEDKMVVLSKFSDLTEEEVKPLKDNIDNYSVEDLELQLFALLGKKKVEFSSTDKSSQEKSGHLMFSLSNITKKSTANEPAWVEYVEQYKSKQQ